MMDKDRNTPTADSTKPKDVKKSSGRTEEIQRGSPSPVFATDENALPHYLTASAGSCHDHCKYGHKVTVERKEKHHVSSSAKENENRSKVASKFTNVNVLHTPNEIGSSGEPMNVTTSVPHRNPSGTCADRIAISRRETSEHKPEPRARVREIHEDGPKGRPTPVGSSSAEERPSLHVKKAAAFTGPVLMRQRSRVKVSGHAQTRCIQLDLLEASEEMASKNISDNKPCQKTTAPHAKKVSASVATVFARQRSRTKRPGNAKTQSIIVDLPNASEEVYPDVEPPMSTPSVPQNSKSSGMANTGDNIGTQADHNAVSKSKARQYMNRVPSLKRRSVRKADKPGEPRHESALKAEEKRASRQRSVAVNGDDRRSSDPSKLSFASRKSVEDGPKEEKGPSRLMFRKGGTLGKSPSVRGPLWRRSFSRKRSSRGGIVVDPDTGAQVVVLRHQGSMKRDAPGLFNVVIEETASKLVNTRKSRVKALVGAFESVISSLHGKTGNSR